jgi:hypothetical protein
MSDTPQDLSVTPTSHLTSHMSEVMSGLRMKAMNLLVHELISAFAQENYQLDEFIDALADYAESVSGGEEVAKYLELARAEIVRLRRESGEETR